MADTPYLKTVYDLKGQEVRTYYDKWAATYEDEAQQNRYATPDRCAAALAATGLDKTALLLDFACGTGLSGVALAKAGFTCIDGLDISPEMLRRAQDKKIYRHLTLGDGDGQPRIAPEAYRAITAIGAIGPGAAPASVIAPLINALPQGGYFVISLNDVALQNPDFENALAALNDKLAPVSNDRGAHLPGIDVMSTVLVFQRR